MPLPGLCADRISGDEEVMRSSKVSSTCATLAVSTRLEWCFTVRAVDASVFLMLDS